MASRSGLLFLVVLLGCLVVALGKIAENGLPDREELDTKYLLTNQIVELQEHVEELDAAAKTHATTVKRKDKKIRNLEKELKTATKRTSELDLEVSQLKDELERSKSDYAAALKRAELGEAKAEEEAREKRKLVEVVNEHKAHLKKAERSLQIAQSGMLKAQKESAAKAREVAQSADAWLPPWLATQAAKVHSLVTSRWATHGRPLLKLVQRGVSVRAAQAEKLSRPYVRSFQKNVRPMMRSQWKKVKSTVVPEYRRVKKLTVKYYQTAKKYMLPHLSKVHGSVDPYVQTVREKSQPFVDHAASFLHPHLEKAGDHYQSVVNYHEHLQDSVKGTLGKHQVLARWATKELIWFLASALLALPVVASILVFSSVFGSKKPTKRPRGRPASSSSTSNGTSANKKPRRPKQEK